LNYQPTEYFIQRKIYAFFAAAFAARFSLFLSLFTFSILRSAFHLLRIFFLIPIVGTFIINRAYDT